METMLSLEQRMEDFYLHHGEVVTFHNILDLILFMKICLKVIENKWTPMTLNWYVNNRLKIVHMMIYYVHPV